MKTVIICGLLLLALGFALPPGARAQAERLVIGSGPSPDRIVLAKLLIKMLRYKGISCKDMTGLGSEDMARGALVNGRMDLYPAFTDQVLAEFEDPGKAGQEPGEVFAQAARLDLAKNKLVWIKMTALEDVPRIWLQPALAMSAGLDTISALAAISKTRPDRFKLGMTPDFLFAENGYRPLAQAYGLTLASDNIIQMDRVFLYPALLEKGVDLVVGRSMDWETARLKLASLKDDLGFLRPNNASFVARQEVLADRPRLEPAVSELSALLTTAETARLVGLIQNGADPGLVAFQWLQEKKLIPD